MKIVSQCREQARLVYPWCRFRGQKGDSCSLAGHRPFCGSGQPGFLFSGFGGHCAAVLGIEGELFLFPTFGPSRQTNRPERPLVKGFEVLKGPKFQHCRVERQGTVLLQLLHDSHAKGGIQ